LYTLFGATDCIITRDEHPSISSFIDGASFRDALAAAIDDECAVDSIDDLYIDTDYSGEPSWTSKGFWRFNLRDVRLTSVRRNE
jgi:hypothetical protein